MRKTILLLLLLFCLAAPRASAETLCLPAGLTEIGDEAFRGDTSLDEVILPDGLLCIGPGAFADSSVKSVYLPDSLESIDPTAFAGCRDLVCRGESEASPAARYCRELGLVYEPASGVPEPCRRALLIGETRYEQRLNGPENDVACMERLLAGLSGSWAVCSQMDATREELFELVDLAFGDAEDDDLSLFYYSGHGVTGAGPEASGALQLVDTGYLTTGELAELLGGVRGKVIVILDSCGSGAAISDGTATRGASHTGFDAACFNRAVVEAFGALTPKLRSGELADSRFYVLTGSAYEEESATVLLDGVWGGMLTRAVADALGCAYPSGEWRGAMPADANADSALSLQELYPWCRSCAQQHQHVLAWPSASQRPLFQR